MEALSDVQQETSNRSWASYLGLVILGLVLAELVAHVFVWTYVASEFERRNSTAQVAAICVLGGLTFVFSIACCCPSEPRCNAAFWGRTWRRLTVILIGTVLLAVSPQVLVFNVINWSNIAWRALVVAPLCVVLLAGCWILFVARSRASQELRFVAVFAGIGIGYALLGEFGSIWPLLAMSAVTWGYIWRISRSQDEQPAGGAVWWLGAGVAALVLVHVFFTDWPFGWVVALLFTLGIPCILIARMIIEPPEVPMLAPSDEGAVPALPRRRSRFGRVASSDELLLLGWIVVVFWLCCWTQPERLDVGAPPSVSMMPEPIEPTPDLAFGGDSLSEAAALYSAEWDRYNAVQFENGIRSSVHYLMEQQYREMEQEAESWNAVVGPEVTARQVIKSTSMLAIIGFSWLHSRRASRKKNGLPDEAIINSGVAPMQRA
ncbi:MAG: hypothetical protein J5J06_20025 [Phycisphaerae bacterium]|nr:hypothetical protein [Phycisphaerae bacterium]